MNFLALAQKVYQECKFPSGTAARPTAVTGQSGQLKRIVDWTADAYKELQRLHPNWRWMRRAFTLNTVLGDGIYAFGDATDVDVGVAISRFSRWWLNDLYDQPKSYLSSSGVSVEYRLIWLPWESFKYLYRIGTQNNGKPVHISVDPQNNLVLGPKPDGVYVVSGDFQRGVQVLAADGDTPDMPADYHDLIVYYAMEKYGANAVAAETFARARLEAHRSLRALELNQLPDICIAPPLC